MMVEWCRRRARGAVQAASAACSSRPPLPLPPPPPPAPEPTRTATNGRPRARHAEASSVSAGALRQSVSAAGAAAVAVEGPEQSTATLASPWCVPRARAHSAVGATAAIADASTASTCLRTCDYALQCHFLVNKISMIIDHDTDQVIIESKLYHDEYE